MKWRTEEIQAELVDLRARLAAAERERDAERDARRVAWARTLELEAQATAARAERDQNWESWRCQWDISEQLRAELAEAQAEVERWERRARIREERADEAESRVARLEQALRQARDTLAAYKGCGSYHCLFDDDHEELVAAIDAALGGDPHDAG